MSTRSRSNPGGARVLDMGEVRPFRDRKPPWFKRPAPGGPAYRELRGMIEGQDLHTVCQEAACPNIGECWERGTATFMILGDTCTRRCGFCNVKTGKPTHHDPLEPLRVAQSVRKMGLRHAVITSVDRDDLPDLGASAFVGVIRSIRRMAPGCKVEVLTPDFRGEEMPLARVIAERPDVFNHNVETVPRLYPLARRGSRFLRSCRVLRNAKEMGGDEVVTKSGLMTGLGESKDELLEAFGVLREHGVQVLTVGQYLRPTRDHLPVVRYWHPDEFAELEREAYAMGFESVAAGPLVRSSYHAEQTLAQASSPLPLIPLKDDIPTSRFPIVTVVLIAINVIVYFVFEQGLWDLSGVGNERVVEYGAIPLEITHPGTECIAVTNGIECGPDSAIADQAPFWVTIITSMFLHGSLFHLGGNMLFLWIFGNNIEDSMNRLVFVGFYLLGGLAALGLQVAMDTNSAIPTVGASGAIAAVLGAYARLYPRARVVTLIIIIIFFTIVTLPALLVLGLWFLLQLLPAFSEPISGSGGGVAYFAHIGGFLFGLLAIKLFATKVNEDYDQARRTPVY